MTDLPLSGRIVQLLVIARRFRCDAVLCGRQIFTERFAEEVLAPSARHTARLDSIVHHLGLALGGRPAAGFAKRLYCHRLVTAADEQFPHLLADIAHRFDGIDDQVK